jgi:hypothetical protein
MKGTTTSFARQFLCSTKRGDAAGEVNGRQGWDWVEPVSPIP